MPGFRGSLVDEEGFPRSDIDVHAVREARHHLICLQNDYRDAQRRLEELMFRLHAEFSRSGPEQQAQTPAVHRGGAGLTAACGEAPPRLQGENLLELGLLLLHISGWLLHAFASVQHILLVPFAKVTRLTVLQLF